MVIVGVILIFCFLIVSHEFGHFIVAKACGIYVEDFSLGMGPKLWSYKGKETQYTLRLFPIGGWCKMIGEDEDSTHPRAFSMKPIWQRICVVAAGPLMNILCAVIIFIVLFMFMGTPSTSTRVGAVMDNGPAAEAGILADDYILRIDGIEVESWLEISEAINTSMEDKTSGASLPVIVERDGKEVSLSVTPYYTEDTGLYKFGIEQGIDRQNIFTAIGLGVKQSYVFARELLKALFMMVTGQMAVDVAGPVGIVNFVDEAAGYGVQTVILVIGYLCINLAVINLLPFPALDGFRIFTLVVEAIRHKPFDRNKEGIINLIGLLILFALMIVITYNDIVRLIE